MGWIEAIAENKYAAIFAIILVLSITAYNIYDTYEESQIKIETVHAKSFCVKSGVDFDKCVQFMK